MNPKTAEDNNAVVGSIRSATDHYSDLSDEELLDLARTGNRAAYALLWTRHSASGLVSARYFSTDLDPHDVVAEAYSKIYIALTRGGGPKTAFRTYLQVTIRNIANKWRNEQRRLVDLESAERSESLQTVSDDADSRVERSIIKEAFTSLPTQWQEVLWYTEVLELKPQAIAAKLNMTPNSVSALSYRARDGLRQAWIRAHLNDNNLPAACVETIDRLPAYLLGTLTEKRSEKLLAHLATCASCSKVLAEAESTASRLHSVVLPLLLTGGMAAGLTASLAAPASSAQAATQVVSGTTQTATIGGTKVALLAAAGVLIAGVISAAIVLSTVAKPSESAADNPVTGSSSAQEQPTPSAERDGTSDNPAQDPTVVDRSDWTQRQGEAETAALFSIPVVAGTEAPTYSFDERTVFATSAPLLTGYATAGSEVTLFVSGDEAAYQERVVQTTAAGSWSLSSETLPDGEYTVHAYQQVSGEDRSDTATRAFIVRNGQVLPTPVVASVDTADTRFLPIVTGTGIPGATVSVLVNGVANDSAIAPDGTWSVTTTRGGIAGGNTLVVRQKDRATLTYSHETDAQAFELTAPMIELDKSRSETVLIVDALPQSSVTVTDGLSFTHRIAATDGVSRIRLLDNSTLQSVEKARPVRSVYTGEDGTRVGAPILTDLEL
ncbi:sigma-70 family RNA polymerase sigma factor [Lysinibacter cavernae]|uniref:RNA polymerase sigma factor (Sigma-70 family) n=1 Tax=Lysinibacter cavernae TaxID=1640652 RepID=A0A7X5R2D6_9MICO|nr:RNA polymerase sigma factor (sigma-70 family) [Lysinibacter cavernae]